MNKCKFCNREFTTNKGLKFHERYCKSNPNRKTINTKDKIKYGVFICEFCNREFTTLRGLKFHQGCCKLNNNLLYKRHAWNKDKNKFNDKLIQKYGLTLRKLHKEGLIVSPMKGKHISDEVKLKISNSRKLYIEQHPENSTWINKQHSYAERYFEYIFKKENIQLKHHKMIGRYELDFYNEQNKKYVEIDGEQHYTESGLKHDEIRTKYLFNLGWDGMRIRWSQYCKMNINERKEVIEKIKKFI